MNLYYASYPDNRLCFRFALGLQQIQDERFLFLIFIFLGSAAHQTAQIAGDDSPKLSFGVLVDGRALHQFRS